MDNFTNYLRIVAKRQWLKHLFLTAILLLATVSTFAYDFEKDGIYYNKLSDNTVEVIGIQEKYSGELVIPATVDYEGVNYSVTSIGILAFWKSTGLTSVSIPDGVTSIGIDAFADCSGLTSITIPDGVTYIGDFAFSGCSGLTSINIPDAVTYIGGGLFSNCSNLTSINIGENNSCFKIHEGVLYNIEQTRLIQCLANVTGDFSIPNGVIRIEKGAFMGCSGLTSIKISNTVTRIDDSAFYGCSGLTSINIPDGVVWIGNQAFYNCSSLTAINIPGSDTQIGGLAFTGCSSLAFINVGDNNAKFKSYEGVLYNKEMTTLIACPGGFTGSVMVPNGITSIESYAFYGCSGLTSINIPDGVTSIEYHTFAYCSGLTSITVGKGVSSVGYCAFHNCANITSIVCHSDMPPTCDVTGLGSFYGISRKDCTLYVPENSIDSYKSTSPWSEFTNIKGISTGIQNINADGGVVVSSNAGSITISGTTGGETIDVYNVSGSKIKSVSADGGETNICGLTSGNVYIVNVGKKTIKVAM